MSPSPGPQRDEAAGTGQEAPSRTSLRPSPKEVMGDSSLPPAPGGCVWGWQGQATHQQRPQKERTVFLSFGGTGGRALPDAASSSCGASGASSQSACHGGLLALGAPKVKPRNSSIGGTQAYVVLGPGPAHCSGRWRKAGVALRANFPGLPGVLRGTSPTFSAHCVC